MNSEFMKEEMAKEREFNEPYQVGYSHQDEEQEALITEHEV